MTDSAYIHEDSGRRNLTALKRRQEEIHQLLLDIIALKPEKRHSLPLDNEALKLFERLAGMADGDPRNRELRYAAKCFEQWDQEGIESAMRQMQQRHHELLQLETPIHQWHKTLIEDPQKITDFVQQYPAAQQQLQQLRQRVRNAAKEQKKNLKIENPKQQASKSAQALLQSVRHIMRA